MQTAETRRTYTADDVLTEHAMSQLATVTEQIQHEFPGMTFSMAMDWALSTVPEGGLPVCRPRVLAAWIARACSGIASLDG